MNIEFQPPSEKVFYFNLSLLYYAMGMADGKFIPEEKRSVIKVIKSNWLQHHVDFNIEEVMYTQLKNLVDSKVKAEEAFGLFKQYYEQNTEVFTEANRKQILEDIYFIASSYSRRNKSELVLYSRVVNLFFPPK